MQQQTRQVLIHWTRQFGATMAAYVAAFAISIWAVNFQAAGPIKTTLVVLPVLPGLILLWLTVRSYRRCDEFIQLRILQAATLAAFVTTIFSLVYFFLELSGLPRLSAAWISNILWAVFVVQMVRLIATDK